MLKGLDCGAGEQSKITLKSTDHVKNDAKASKSYVNINTYKTQLSGSQGSHAGIAGTNS